MCGIVGVIGDHRQEEIRSMLERTAHRGEDARRFRAFDRFGAIGINRLPIIDLARGDQPLFNEDGTVAVVCNGEIYNHEAIRADLRADHDFRTRSDAEVLDEPDAVLANVARWADGRVPPKGPGAPPPAASLRRST